MNSTSELIFACFGDSENNVCHTADKLYVYFSLKMCRKD